MPYTHTLSLSIGGDEPIWEGEATVIYRVLWGAPEQGPSYDSGGQPADPDEFDDIRVTHIDGRAVGSREFGKFEAETIAAHIEGSEVLLDQLLTAAIEEESGNYEAAMESLWEQRQEY